MGSGAAGVAAGGPGGGLTVGAAAPAAVVVAFRLGALAAGAAVGAPRALAASVARASWAASAGLGASVGLAGAAVAAGFGAAACCWVGAGAAAPQAARVRPARARAMRLRADRPAMVHSIAQAIQIGPTPCGLAPDYLRFSPQRHKDTKESNCYLCDSVGNRSRYGRRALPPCHPERVHRPVARPCVSGARRISAVAGRALTCRARDPSPGRSARACLRYVARLRVTSGRACSSRPFR